MTQPYPTKISLIGRVQSPNGPAMLLSLDGQWVTCFPQLIDSTERDDIDGLHPTYLIPKDGSLKPKEKMIQGPKIYGFDCLYFWMNKGEQLRLTPAAMLRRIFGETVPEAANSSNVYQLDNYRKH